MSKKINLIINGMEIKANEGDKLLAVAKNNGIEIPHLCSNERLDPIGACRMCVVEVEGFPKLMTSWTTPIREGMVVKTHSPKVIKSRKINMELLLANHNRDCLTCAQNLSCKLQKYSNELCLSEVRYKGEKRKSVPDESSVSIRRDNSKCILCGQCYRVCNEIQTVYAIGQQNRGFNTVVAPPMGLNMRDSSCVNCGQCVVSCPVGALSEKNDLTQIIEILNDKKGKIIIAQTAPSIRAALGESFGMKPGVAVTGKMVTALREVGFDKVFDTDLAADLTIVEEATEFVKRFKSGENLPMITTCCPAWIKFGEQFYFEQLNHMSSCKSPQAMMATLIKTWYAEKIGKKESDIVLVDIMPCTAKKFEIQRQELRGDADFVLTTVELAKLLKQFNVNFPNLGDSDFDNPLGESTGAGVIFGRSGGVMEAALRTAADYVSGKNLKHFDYEKVRGEKTKKEAIVDIDGVEVKVCVVHTLGEAREIMDAIRRGDCDYHFVEIMACHGGCIGGGGQPRYDGDRTEILKLRRKAITSEDVSKKIRKSHKNPSVIKLYKEYIGEPGSKRAHKLLHTTYVKRDVL